MQNIFKHILYNGEGLYKRNADLVHSKKKHIRDKLILRQFILDSIDFL